MQDRHIGDVRVTRIEEQMGPGFPAKDFFPEFDAEVFAAETKWLAPNYYQPESGRLMTSLHWLQMRWQMLLRIVCLLLVRSMVYLGRTMR